MRKMLIPPSAIRRMDVTTLRSRADEMQAQSAGATPEARQTLYNTYVALTDEIARRHEKGLLHPLLIKRSAVYKMGADELREQVAEMTATPNAGDPAWANTVELMLGELARRKVIAKRTYDRRKAENSLSM